MTLRPLAVLALVLPIASRGADVFSPGDLSSPHRALSGLENCTKCHPAGKQLSQERCLECHKELAPEVAAHRGYHGLMAPKDRDCWTCHHEHQGKDFQLVDFGPGGEKAFDHARTGAPLKGQHAPVACASCHARALIRDAAVKALLAEEPRRHTFLGAPPMAACASCHFDEHRGQLGQDCKSCHTENAWKPAPLFDHGKTGYPLLGRHREVDCAKCHPRARAPLAERGALTAPISADTFVRYRPLEHASCASCHADEHRGQLGLDCKRCHTESGWKPTPLFDHARTDYPLTGKHREVDCAKCHPRVEAPRLEAAALTGPVVKETMARYRPLAHASCQDCHRDVHEGRFGSACARCHDTEDWKRVKSEGAAERAFHDQTRYPLRGAHAQVSCVACHGPFPGEPARFKDLPFGACADCHLDAHLGQFAAQGPGAGACDRCHDLTSFEPRFGPQEHARTSYPLEGAHRVVACAACHPQDARLAERVPLALREELSRRGRPVKVSLAVYRLAGDLGRCETCHADPHGGQLDRKEGCVACHNVESFARLRFDHQRDSRFPLEGRHATLACAACHASEATPQGPLVRYKPLPVACAGCHADVHAGQFAASRAAGATTDCARCHGSDDFRKLFFRHEPPFTDYRLTGAHLRVDCLKCHPAVLVARGVTARRYRPLPRACSGCHADFHHGEFRGFAPDRPTP